METNNKTPVFKYKEQIESYKPDLSQFKEQSGRIAAIWAFEPITNPKNFLPKYVRNEKAQQDSFTGWCLSAFVDVDKAKSRFEEVTKGKTNLHKKLGTHVSTGKLEKEDGVSDTENDKGHFNHIEYEGIILSNKFEIGIKIS